MALYFAVGLLLFAGSEPGGLSLILLDINGYDHFRKISKKHSICLRVKELLKSKKLEGKCLSSTLSIMKCAQLKKWAKQEASFSSVLRFPNGPFVD